MRRTFLLLAAALLALPPAVPADHHEGAATAARPVTRRSAHDVGATMDRLEALVRDKGFTVFARIDHAAGAASAGQPLRPTQLLIFGNPAVGSALMRSNQAVALELPIRVLVYEDGGGAVRLAYTAPSVLAARYGIDDRPEVIRRMTRALAELTRQAAATDAQAAAADE